MSAQTYPRGWCRPGDHLTAGEVNALVLSCAKKHGELMTKWFLEDFFSEAQLISPFFTYLRGKPCSPRTWCHSSFWFRGPLRKQCFGTTCSGRITLMLTWCRQSLFCGRGWVEIMKAVYTVMFTVYKWLKLQPLKIRDLKKYNPPHTWGGYHPLLT